MDEMDPTVGVVFDRLAEDAALPEGVKDLVVGALLDDLDSAIGGGIESPARSGGPAEVPPPARAYLGKISVRGFRGVGPESVLPLQPGPGLTLVVGRNGSGKSSFAEAAELALTGECSRWVTVHGAAVPADDSSRVARGSWRYDGPSQGTFAPRTQRRPVVGSV